MPEKSAARLFVYPTVLLLFIFLLETTGVRLGIQEGLRLSFLAVVPSVFPFAVLSGYIVGNLQHGKENILFRPLQKLLALPPGGVACFLIGLFCGFPLGAKCIADGYRNGMFSKEDATRMLMFCNNTGPAFLVGAVGGILASPRTGWLLFFIQTALVLLVALLTRRRLTPPPSHCTLSRSTTITQAVTGGVNATLMVIGFILFFSACITVMQTYLPTSLLLPFASVLEVSTACRLAASAPHGVVWIAFSVLFSGISVHLQTAAVLHDTDISMRPYLLSKALIGLIGAFLVFVIL